MIEYEYVRLAILERYDLFDVVRYHLNVTDSPSADIAFRAEFLG